MLILPADATHVYIGQLVKFYKLHELSNREANWMVWSQIFNKWVKLYSAIGRDGNLLNPNTIEKSNKYIGFLNINDSVAQDYLTKIGVIKRPELPINTIVGRTGTIMISEENLRRIIKHSFEVGYVTGCKPASCKEEIELQYMDASSALRVKAPGFVQSMVDWFDDRPKIKPKVEVGDILDSDYPK